VVKKINKVCIRNSSFGYTTRNTATRISNQRAACSTVYTACKILQPLFEVNGLKCWTDSLHASVSSYDHVRLCNAMLYVKSMALK